LQPGHNNQSIRMNHHHKRQRSLLCAVVAGATPVLLNAAEGNFIDGSSATLNARNYAINRDFSDIVGANPQSMAQEWAQGFILNLESGYSEGPVGFGADALGLLGVKLDSGSGRSNTGLLPVGEDGEAADDYSRLGLTGKMRISNSELKVGELQPNVPVLASSDIRLLPPSFQGLSVSSGEVAGLTLQAAHLNSTSLRNEAGHEKMFAMLGRLPQRGALSDAFNYAGGDYAFNSARSTASAWYGQLEDIYNQHFLGLKQSQPLGAWNLGANFAYYDAQEDGARQLGAIDNQALSSLLSVNRGGHTFYLGYEVMYGDSAFPRVFANHSSLSNEVLLYEFCSIDERSWQVRYDYDFGALGVPGLIAGARYVEGDNVDTGRGFEGEDFERDLDIGYTVQSGPLQNLNVRVRNGMARSNYRSDIDENRLIVNYTWSLL
jgi:hypothetical protein